MNKYIMYHARLLLAMRMANKYEKVGQFAYHAKGREGKKNIDPAENSDEPAVDHTWCWKTLGHVLAVVSVQAVEHEAAQSQAEDDRTEGLHDWRFELSSFIVLSTIIVIGAKTAVVVVPTLLVVLLLVGSAWCQCDVSIPLLHISPVEAECWDH